MIKEVTKQNTITNIEPTISEGKGIYLITKNKLHICEDGADFMDMMQQLPEYEPMVLIKGELETLHAEMGRHDLINAIRALEPQEVYDNLTAQSKINKTVLLMPPATPDWSKGIEEMVTIDTPQESTKPIVDALTSDTDIDD